MKPRIGLWLALVTLGVGFAGPVRAIDPVNETFLGTAIHGYDPVAYFTEHEPVEGSAEHSLEWRGARWTFASAENRAAFEADPERYAPRYGGYCAYAVSQGTTADIDPEAWEIVGDRLYLNLNAQIQSIWQQDIEGYVRRADEHWPVLLRRE